MIDLDDLLTGNPSMEEVSEYWAKGDFYEEQYLVEAIERWLLTEEQRLALFNKRLSIEKILNGRFPCTDEYLEFINSLYNEWNNKLGITTFGV